jgi:hypothetical protein
MANDDKQTGANLACSGVVLAAVAVAGTTYLVGPEAPLRGSRPAMTEPQFHQSVTDQDVDARLWQDPFAAITKTIEKTPPDKSEHYEVAAPGGATAAATATHCLTPLATVEIRQSTLMTRRHNAGSPICGGWRGPAAHAVIYMLRGDNGASETDPRATEETADNNWIKTGPHVMIVGAQAKNLFAAYPRDAKPDPTKPYVMWPGTAYEHLMLPVK